MLNILTKRLIRMDTAGGTVEATLPEVYAALMDDKVDAFPALRPHQRHAWHAFLVQLGAMALHRTGLSQPPAAAAEWCKLIRSLTPDYQNDEPWQLVVEDITKPAFMQPPASAASKRKEYKPVKTLDGLDVLIASTNHHLKWTILSSVEVNDLIFALISLQTMGWYSKAGRYGNYYHISRVNSNFGNRPALSLTPSMRQGIHVRRDIEALLECRDLLLNEYPDYPRDDGVRLLWVKTWDGTKSLPISELDIFYIEICHRIRLGDSPDRLINAVRAPSTAARVEAKALNGVTGDPWTPINRKESKSLTLAPSGFTYKTIAECLSSHWKHPPLVALTAAERSSPQDMVLVARGMVRGQGKTEGYHERIVPFNERVVRVFGRPGGIQMLGDIARERIKQIGVVESALRDAVATFAVQGKDIRELLLSQRRRLREAAIPWSNKLDEIVDRQFFDALQYEFQADGPDKRQRIRKQWLMNEKDGVVDHAWQILRNAEDSVPCPAIQRYRARVRADSVFNSRIRGPSGLPFLFDDEGGE